MNLTETAQSHPRNSLISITFIEDEAKRLHHSYFDALVVDLEIKRHRVMQNLIDNGSSTNIIFSRSLNLLDLPDKTLRPVNNKLRGFAGNEVVPLGQITLQVTFKTFPCFVTVKVKFVIVDYPFVYNTIIRRITQHAIQGIASTYHLRMKFPTSFRVGVVDRVQTLNRETYRMATSFRSEQP